MNNNTMNHLGAALLARAAAKGYPFLPQEAQLLSGGRINQNYLVRTEGESFVLRLYPRGRAAQQILFEMSLQDHLFENDCRVPSIIKSSSGSVVGLHEGRNFVWLQYLDATPLSPEAGYNLCVSALGSLLTPIFFGLESFAPPFSGTTETGVFRRRLPPLLSALRNAGRTPTADSLQDLFDDLRRWERKLTLPTSALHADIHPGNILKNRHDDGLWLIDFDDGHVGFRAVDWVLPALEFAFDTSDHFDEQRYEALLSTWLPARATPEEHAALPRLRILLTLKFAAAMADLGDPLEENRYLKLLSKTLSF